MNISQFTPKQRKNDMYVVASTKLHLFCYVPFGVRYVGSFDSYDDLMEFCEQHGVIPDMSLYESKLASIISNVCIK